MRRSIYGPVLLISLFCFSFSLGQEEGHLHKEFKAKSTVDIKLVSGDCNILSGEGDVIKVDVIYRIKPKKAFAPEFREHNQSLKISENWFGSSSGQVTWTITVPAKTEIEFSSASGDLTLEGEIKSAEGHTASGDINLSQTKGDYDFRTASGDIEVEEAQGEFEFKTASGDVSLKECSGTFDISTASGDIEAEDVILKEEASFSAASGDVELQLARSAEDDLEISTASGNVRLDYNGNKIMGRFELSARKNHGRIKSDLAFDSETELERYDQTYLKKIFKRGSESPLIFLRSASGNVTFKK